MWKIWWPSRVRLQQTMPSTWACANHVVLSCTPFLSLCLRCMDLIDGPLDNHIQKIAVKGSISAMSDIPHGSVLGQILFTIFVGDIHNGIECILGKFSNYTMLCGGGKEHHPKEPWKASPYGPLKVLQGQCKVLHSMSSVNRQKTNILTRKPPQNPVLTWSSQICCYLSPLSPKWSGGW